MSDSENETLVDALAAEIRGVTLRERAVTILLAVGILSFGVALGVKWAAVETINTLHTSEMVLGGYGPVLAPKYNPMMQRALVVAGLTLAGAVVLDTRGRRMSLNERLSEGDQ